MRSTHPASFLFLATFLVASAAVDAQHPGAEQSDDPTFAEARELLQSGRAEIIRDEIRFTQKESMAFWAAYEKYEDDILAVRNRQADLVVNYIRLYRAGTVSEEIAVSLVDDYLDIKSDLLQVQRKHLKRFRQILPPRKVARFYQLENKLDAEVDAQLALYVPLIDPI